MKVTLERNNLLKSLGHVHRVVERRNTYPILANVLISANEDGVDLRATDLDIEVTEHIGAMVSEAGATTVPAHTFYEIIRKLADGAEVKLETDDNEQLIISSSRSNFTLACLSADGFPDLKSESFENNFSIDAKTLSELIERTQFAISNEETRYYLNGIYMHTINIDGEEFLRAVATDGHRMARAQVVAPDGASGMAGIIIPRKTISEVQKLLDGSDSEVQIELSATKIRFSIDSVILLSKLIEGTFPDYERVTPKDNDKKMLVNRTDFANAVDRVSTIASERGGKAVKLIANNNQLELIVTNPDHGTANEQLSIEFDESDFEIGFNARYLLDIVTQIRSDNIIFMFNNSGSPSLLLEEENDSALYVLMPMRV